MRLDHLLSKEKPILKNLLFILECTYAEASIARPYFKNIQKFIVKSEELIVKSTKFAIKCEFKKFIIHY